MMVSTSIIAVTTILMIWYLSKVLGYYLAWEKTKEYAPGKLKPADDIFISLVIASRNEENNVKSLVRSIRDQQLSPGLHEIIFVDDHSTDQTARVLENMIKGMPNAKVIALENHEKGKKQALAKGIGLAKGNYIVTTDADCTLHPLWLQSIYDYVLVNKPVLLSGPVWIKPRGLLSRVEALEFASLVASGAASFMQKKPVMCNGANLAFQKSMYHECKEKLHAGHPSGDDIFLMLAASRQYRDRVHYHKYPGNIVYTQPAGGIKSFIHQRLRWASKTSRYQGGAILTTAILVFLLNSFMLLLAVLSFFNEVYLVALIMAVLIKMATDYIFLNSFARYYQQQYLLKFIPVLSLIYPVYIVFTGILGRFGSYSWKGRKHGSKPKPPV